MMIEVLLKVMRPVGVSVMVVGSLMLVAVMVKVVHHRPHRWCFDPVVR